MGARSSRCREKEQRLDLHKDGPPAHISVRTLVRRRAHPLLASARGSQYFVKRNICAKFREQRIGKQIFVRAIVLLDRALEQMKRRLFLTTVREERSLVIPRLGVGIVGQTGFSFVGQLIKIRWWPPLQE